MLSFIGKLLPLLIFFSHLLLAGPPNKQYIKKGFEEFGRDTEENQIQHLEDNQVQLSPGILESQYESLDQEKQETFLKDQLRKLSPTDQQALVNSLNHELTYSDLLMNISTEGRKQLIDTINPEYIGTTPLIDWLNTSNLKSYFNPTTKIALLNRGHYNDFNSFDQLSLWVEPFGYYAKFHRGDKVRQFNLYTLGISTGGEYTFLERFSLSAGFSYSYSKIDWKGYPYVQKGRDHALYFGPSLNYLFTKGHISFALLGTCNFYHVKRDHFLFPEEIRKKRKGENSYSSWDVLVRLDGELSLNLGASIYLYPSLQLDYLNVFQLKNSEKIEKDVSLNIGGLHAGFFYSKVGIKMTREVFQPAIGFIIPSVGFGVKNYIPLSDYSYHYTIRTCNGEKSLSFGPWTQYFFDAGLSWTHVKGRVLILGYEFTGGYYSPLQKIFFKLGWNW